MTIERQSVSIATGKWQVFCTSLLVIYIWWIIATPFNRFDFLSTIRFEKILVAALILAVAFLRREGNRFSSITIWYVIFFSTLVISFVASPYSDTIYAQAWLREYWKTIVLFFLFVYGIANTRQLVIVIISVGVITVLYETQSLLDFLSGGSYVYQQGIRRLAGVWSGGGIGAANAIGSMSVYAVPHVFFWLEIAQNRRSKVFAGLALIVLIVSTLFSGVRAAFVVILFFFSWHFRSWIFKPFRLFGIALIGVAIFLSLPQEYQSRYLSIVRETPEVEIRTERDAKVAAIASSSAQSRVQGLIDGWNMFLRRPLVGYGPGGSIPGRALVNENFGAGGRDPLQLHNLYGQLLAEAGLFGSVAFCILVVSIMRNSRRMYRNFSLNTQQSAIYRFFLGQALVMVAYGMFSHTLYSERWALMFALYVVALNTVSIDTDGNQKRSVDVPTAKKAEL